jgi:transcriptional regulator with XRE-family HTH domain
MANETFQQRLARLRKSKGMTQQELSDKTGLSRRAIGHYETKGWDIPPKSAVHLAKALDVSIDDLFGYKPSPKEEFIKSRKIFRKMRDLETLPRQNQKTVLDLIDALKRRTGNTPAK